MMQRTPYQHSAELTRLVVNSLRTLSARPANRRALTSARSAHRPQACRVSGCRIGVSSGCCCVREALLGQRLRCAVVTACGVTLGGLGVKSALAQCNYEVSTFVEMLPCEPIGPVHVRFFGLNEHGQACGSRGKCTIDINHNSPLPIVWTPELGLVTLPLPEGATNGVANDINDVLGSDGFGQVACTISVPSLGGNRPYVYDDGIWIPLGLLPGTLIGQGLAVNDSTEVVGTAVDPTDGPAIAFLWVDGELAEVDVPLGPNSFALDISQRSAIVGLMGGAITGDSFGFLLTGNNVQSIPPITGGISCEARGVNNEDIVTGQSLIAVKRGPTPRRSWVFEKGTLTELGILSNTFRTISEDINDAKQIVGHSTTPNFGLFPFIWQDGQIHNIRDLYDDTTLPPMLQAMAINNNGQIAGIAAPDRGIILTPIDRPIGDVNLNCQVDADDLMLVLGAWGSCPDLGSCLSDFVSSATFQPPSDGVVDAADLAVVLGNWTESGSALPLKRRQ